MLKAKHNGTIRTHGLDFQSIRVVWSVVLGVMSSFIEQIRWNGWKYLMRPLSVLVSMSVPDDKSLFLADFHSEKNHTGASDAFTRYPQQLE